MPTIVTEKCIKCLKCEKDCPSDAISIETGVINNSCIHCGHCVAICPEEAVLPDTGRIIPLKDITVNANDFEQLSANLRSCRSYSKRAVSEKTIVKLIENMKHYPSASNARPIQVTVVKTPEKVQQLNDDTASALIKSLSKVSNPVVKTILKVTAPSMNTKGLSAYKTKLTERQAIDTSQICRHAPVVMLFHGVNNRFGMADTDAQIWATYTSIYAKTMGLGSCFIGFIVKAMEQNKSMKKDYNIPENHRVFAALILGYPKVNYVNETSREKPGYQLI